MLPNVSPFSLRPPSRLLSAGLAIFISIVLQILAFLSGIPNPGAAVGTLVWSLACGWIVYRILGKHSLHHYRFYLFLLLAGGTLLAVPSGARPSAFTCHIALAAFLGPMAANGLAAASSNPSTWGGFYAAAAGYLLLTMVLGTGWCAWACGFGAWDEAFARIGERRPGPRWRLPGPAGWWRALGLGLLLAMVLIGLHTREADWCRWLCPFKLDSNCGVAMGVPGSRSLQLGLMIAIAGVAVIAVPLATGRRFFCAYLCPFGAWQALVTRFHPVRITCLVSRCTGCGRCGEICRIQAVALDRDRHPVIQAACNRCGRCLEECPQEALTLAWGRRPQGETLRIALVVSSVLVAGMVGSRIWGAVAGRAWSWWVGQA